MLQRRGFLGGLVAALAAPAAIRTPRLLIPARMVDFAGPMMTASDVMARRAEADYFMEGVTLGPTVTFNMRASGYAFFIPGEWRHAILGATV